MQYNILELLNIFGHSDIYNQGEKINLPYLAVKGSKINGLIHQMHCVSTSKMVTNLGIFSQNYNVDATDWIQVHF